MKIKTAIVISLLFASLVGISQTKGDVRIGTYGQIMYLGNKIIPQYGLLGEIFVADNFSVNYKYGIGTNQNGEITGHINPAIFLLAFTDGSAASLLGTLMICEGVSYHVAVNDYIELAPYISPLGAELNLYPDVPILLSCSAGINMYVKYITPLKSLSFCPYAGAMIIYRDGNVLPVLGFSLNFTFH
jgi:hypothetical protein